MSGGYSCKCPEREKPINVRRWYVLQRNGNQSAFAGYRWTPSAYSCVQCHICGAVWRTKSNFVTKLKDGDNLYNLAEDQRPKPDT